MIRFYLLCDLKEVELTEHINQPIQIINRTLRRHVSHSDILSLGPTDVLDILGLDRFPVIGKGATRNPMSFSQACPPTTRD